MKVLKNLSFGLLAILIILLVAATLIEHLHDTDTARTYVYCSPAVILLWGICATAGMLCLRKAGKMVGWGGWCIHSAFVLMLTGALTTHLFSESGKVELAVGAGSVDGFTRKDGSVGHFPFKISLTDCETVHYPGTEAPMDYVSKVEISEEGKTHAGEVSMNNIFSYKHWRFYQTRMSEGFSVLTVNHDPWGIGITYAGYALLFIGIVIFFFQKKSGMRDVLRHPLIQKGTLALLLMVTTGSATAQEAAPKTVQRGIGKTFGQLYVYHNDRVQPLQTLARDFCTKLCGSPSYEGLTAEQVTAGWIFYYEVWKNVRMIHIDDDKIRQTLGIEDNWAALTDFYDAKGYKLLRIEEAKRDRAWLEADEKCKLAGWVCTGKILRIFPYQTAEGQTQWLSWVETLPQEMEHEDKQFVLGSMDYVAQCLQAGKNIEANETLKKIRSFQQQKAGKGHLPDAAQFEAERIYNQLSQTRPVSMACMTLGILFYLLAVRALSCRRNLHKTANRIQILLVMSLFIWTTVLLGLRGYVGGYLPLSNGFETMLALVWCLTLTGLTLGHRFVLIRPFSLLIGGLALLVATIGGKNPAITPLMPVLSSPLLSLHVVVIMVAYALLSIIALNGATGLFFALIHRNGKGGQQQEAVLSLVSRLLLYPAVLLLAIGIFIGAIWANQSWGTYWSWDPKETWALITLLVYMFPLHSRTLQDFSRPNVFNAYSLAAFAAVLMTYFGVNFLLGGMHSYA